MAEASYPDDLLYHAEHDWAKVDGDSATFGITWYAQDALGEIVFFQPPEVGATVTQGQPYAEIESVEALFKDIPEGLRLTRELELDAGLSEQEVYEEMKALAASNTSAEDEITFLGAGMYDHYVPALVDSIILRSEFLTPYTPYQPEISQGGLQAMFEYQTAISELTGLPVSNAS